MIQKIAETANYPNGVIFRSPFGTLKIKKINIVLHGVNLPLLWYTDSFLKIDLPVWADVCIRCMDVLMEDPTPKASFVIQPIAGG